MEMYEIINKKALGTDKSVYQGFKAINTLTLIKNHYRNSGYIYEEQQYISEKLQYIDEIQDISPKNSNISPKTALSTFHC